MNAKCPDLVREAFVRIADLAAQGEQGTCRLGCLLRLPFCPTLTVVEWHPSCQYSKIVMNLFLCFAGLAKLTDVFHLCSPLTVDMVCLL